MEEQQDQTTNRDLGAEDQPVDAAGKSLADALRASFSVLKGIMMVLVVLYLVSNVRGIESHEEALVLRLGALRTVVDQAGLVWAFPYPIDEIVPLPTKKSNELVISSQTFRRTPQEMGKPLSFISRSPRQGLHPVLDGALLTADHGLVHVQWKVTYKIDNVGSFVSKIQGDQVETAEALILTYVETAGVEVASEMTAEEIIRTKVEMVQSEMLRRVNARLSAIDSGVVVTHVEMFEPTPPIAVRPAFEETQRRENLKQRAIRTAETERTRRLSQAAGGAYPKLIALLDEIDRDASDGKPVMELRQGLDRMLELEVEGEAGRRIKNAGAYRAVVVSQMQSDVERYRTLLPEYKRNPMMLLNRLWEEAKRGIFMQDGVVKLYYPAGVNQIRITIVPDPDQERAVEKKRLGKTQFDVKKLRPDRPVPVGPEYD